MSNKPDAGSVEANRMEHTKIPALWELFRDYSNLAFPEDDAEVSVLRVNRLQGAMEEVRQLLEAHDRMKK